MFTFYIKHRFNTLRVTFGLLLTGFSLFFQSISAQTEKFDSTACRFLNTPYVAHVLDRNSTEKLEISLKEVDCTTFVEYVVAAVLSGQQPDSLNTRYRDAVQKIRYRNGRIRNYASRLHYFSEWITDNEQKKLITEITKSLNGKTMSKKIDFMSTHPQSYAALLRDTTLIDSIRTVEYRLSHTPVFYIPKTEVAAIYPRLKTGDIVAITTSVKGLDISHVGFVWMKNGVAHLMHASSSAHKVIIDPLPLSEYLKNSKSATGIRVLRIRYPEYMSIFTFN